MPFEFFGRASGGGWEKRKKETRALDHFFKFQVRSANNVASLNVRTRNE
jgi:hypothetical protein